MNMNTREYISKRYASFRWVPVEYLIFELGCEGLEEELVRSVYGEYVLVDVMIACIENVLEVGYRDLETAASVSTGVTSVGSKASIVGASGMRYIYTLDDGREFPNIPAISRELNINRSTASYNFHTKGTIGKYKVTRLRHNI